MQTLRSQLKRLLLVVPLASFLLFALVQLLHHHNPDSVYSTHDGFSKQNIKGDTEAYFIPPVRYGGDGIRIGHRLARDSMECKFIPEAYAAPSHSRAPPTV